MASERSTVFTIVMSFDLRIRTTCEQKLEKCLTNYAKSIVSTTAGLSNNCFVPMDSKWDQRFQVGPLMKKLMLTFFLMGLSEKNKIAF